MEMRRSPACGFRVKTGLKAGNGQHRGHRRDRDQWDMAHGEPARPGKPFDDHDNRPGNRTEPG
ncbi:MAG: hypothetical protein HYX94_13100 [Chloroflexi bacterium]|nr:hypothetical protein [Chloroflexota bacterium]